MTEFRPNPLYQHGVVTTNGDGLTIDDVSPLFREHRQAVIDAQSQVAMAKAEAQKAKDAARAAEELAERARQDAETKAAQAAALESEVKIAEDTLTREEEIANTEQKIEEEYAIVLVDEVKAAFAETDEPKKPTRRTRKAAAEE